MIYTALDANKKADLATYDAAARGIIAGLVKVANDGNAAVLAAFAATKITPVIATLDVGEVIPTASGYAGVSPFTAAEYTAVQDLLHQLNVLYTTNIVLISKAAGVNA